MKALMDTMKRHAALILSALLFSYSGATAGDNPVNPGSLSAACGTTTATLAASSIIGFKEMARRAHLCKPSNLVTAAAFTALCGSFQAFAVYRDYNAQLPRRLRIEQNHALLDATAAFSSAAFLKNFPKSDRFFGKTARNFSIAGRLWLAGKGIEKLHYLNTGLTSPASLRKWNNS